MMWMIPLTELFTPWLLGGLVLTFIIVIGLLSYASWLLYKELKAVKDITEYVKQTLNQGFAPPQIINALQNAGWSPGHINKSLIKVASAFAQTQKKAGKDPGSIRIDLIRKGWPIDVVDKVTK